MKESRLKLLVQKAINKDVQNHSKHFSHEIMDRQIEALIKVLAPMIEEVKEDG